MNLKIKIKINKLCDQQKELLKKKKGYQSKHKENTKKKTTKIGQK